MITITIPRWSFVAIAVWLFIVNYSDARDGLRILVALITYTINPTGN
jgi:hypothetical protein